VARGICDCESVFVVEVEDMFVPAEGGGVALLFEAASVTSSSLVFRFKFVLLDSEVESCGVESSIWWGR
jgi:hypothetical protein